MTQGAAARFELVVNGERHVVFDASETPLLWILRDRLGLTATKYGCGLGVCGACTVLEGSRAVRSCTLSLGDAAGRSFTTLEGLSEDAGHPVQRAWLDEDVAQCGYCQAGKILETVALLAGNRSPTDGEVDAALDGVLCRCGTYARARKAVCRAAHLLALRRA